MSTLDPMMIDALQVLGGAAAGYLTAWWMNNRKKIAAAKKAYELDAAGQLWTTPRGARPITQDAVLVIVNGLAYRLETETIKTALTPKPKRTTKKKEQ